MASSSTPDPPEPPPEETRNWLELPQDVMAAIFNKVGVIDVLAYVQMVCSTWRRICKDPIMWRVIDMADLGGMDDVLYDPERMTKRAVDLSCGQLVDISIKFFCTDDLLEYIADRSSKLRRLRLMSCHGCRVPSTALKKLPLLEELHLHNTEISNTAIETAGQFCGSLKSFELSRHRPILPESHVIHVECDDEALTIAKNMPQLRHLQLCGNQMTNVGLEAILNSCLSLESLDLRQCVNVDLNGDLKERCVDRIKDLRFPYDPTNDYDSDCRNYDTDWCDDGDSYGSEDVWSDGFYHNNEYYDIGDYDDYTLPFDDYTLLFDDYSELLDF